MGLTHCCFCWKLEELQLLELQLNFSVLKVDAYFAYKLGRTWLPDWTKARQKTGAKKWNYQQEAAKTKSPTPWKRCCLSVFIIPNIRWMESLQRTHQSSKQHKRRFSLQLAIFDLLFFLLLLPEAFINSSSFLSSSFYLSNNLEPSELSSPWSWVYLVNFN